MSTDQFTFPILRAVASRPIFQPMLNRLLAPFNPFDHRRFENPYPLYDRARTEPIFYHKPSRTWIVTGYQEVDQVLRASVSVDRRHLIEAITPYRKMRQDNVDLVLASMVMRDDPDHGRLRRMVERAFSRKAILNLEPRIATLTAELVGDLRLVDQQAGQALPASRTVDSPVDGPTDVMASFADRLPVYVIAELLGIPADRREDLRELSAMVSKFVDPFTPFDPERMDACIDSLRDLFDELATERQANPTDDLISALVNVEEDGDRLSRDELISMALVLLIGGHETTSSLIGNSIVALGRNPGARHLLGDDPADNRNAVDELLRYDAPVQATDRTVLEEFTVGGKTLPAGAVVLVLFGAANHDPRRYANPDVLQLDREKPQPISFGRGPHYCIGAALAKMETAAAITAFVKAFPNFELDEDGLDWRRSNTFRGPRVLPVRLNGVASNDLGSRSEPRPADRLSRRDEVVAV